MSGVLTQKLGRSTWLVSWATSWKYSSISHFVLRQVK